MVTLGPKKTASLSLIFAFEDRGVVERSSVAAENVGFYVVV